MKFSGLNQSQEPSLPSQVQVYPYTPGWREAIIVKCLAQGHKCHTGDSNPLSAEQNQQSLNSVVLSARPQHPLTIITWCLQKRKLEELIHVKKVEELPAARFRIQRFMFKLSSHVVFEVTIMAVIVLNMIPIIMSFVVQEDHPLYTSYKPGLKISNYVFTAFYTIEAFVKVSLRLKEHYRTGFASKKLLAVYASLNIYA